MKDITLFQPTISPNLGFSLSADDCQAKSGRQTMTAVYHDQSYGSDIKTIVVEFGYTFDIPPDIERLEVVDEALDR